MIHENDAKEKTPLTRKKEKEKKILFGIF